MARSLGYYEKQSGSRYEVILLSYASGGYSMKEIGDYFGLYYSWVSRVIKSGHQANNKTCP